MPLVGIAKELREKRLEREELLKNMDKRIPDFSHPDVFVTFLVGPEPKPTKFVVHREFACYHSKVLNAAFNSNFIEGQTQTYRLEDTTPGTFKLLVQWLYTQKLKVSQAITPSLPAGLAEKAETDADVGCNEEDMNLARLWILADRLRMPKLQNNVMSIIVDISKLYQPAPLTFQHIYKNTAKGSPLRALTIRQCATKLSPWVFTEFSSALPQQLLLDTLVYCAENLRGEADDEVTGMEAEDFFVDVSSV